MDPRVLFARNARQAEQEDYELALESSRDPIDVWVDKARRVMDHYGHPFEDISHLSEDQLDELLGVVPAAARIIGSGGARAGAVVARGVAKGAKAAAKTGGAWVKKNPKKAARLARDAVEYGLDKARERKNKIEHLSNMYNFPTAEFENMEDVALDEMLRQLPSKPSKPSVENWDHQALRDRLATILRRASSTPLAEDTDWEEVFKDITHAASNPWSINEIQAFLDIADLEGLSEAHIGALNREELTELVGALLRHGAKNLAKTAKAPFSFSKWANNRRDNKLRALQQKTAIEKQKKKLAKAKAKNDAATAAAKQAKAKARAQSPSGPKKPGALTKALVKFKDARDAAKKKAAEPRRPALGRKAKTLRPKTRPTPRSKQLRLPAPRKTSVDRKTPVKKTRIDRKTNAKYEPHRFAKKSKLPPMPPPKKDVLKPKSGLPQFKGDDAVRKRVLGASVDRAKLRRLVDDWKAAHA